MKPPKQIVVDVPMSEARRERVEREVFARLDAMRDVDHANHIAPIVRSRRLPLIAAGFAFVAATASVLFLVSREAPRPQPTSPSLVVTPEGGTSRFTVGDAVIDAGSDTSVEVKQDQNGTTTLFLARGSVDCDVMPRPNRAPFRVISGDVTVEVVGTRFEVSRLGTVTRVDVARGKVKVHGNGEQRLLGAGQSWTSAIAGSAVTAVVTPIEPVVTAPTASDTPIVEEEPEIELPAMNARPAKTISPEQAFQAALKIKDEKKRAKAYRVVANGSHTWAAVSLFNLAELQSKFDVEATLETLDELKRRFPDVENAEDAAWFRVEVLRDARRMDEARTAAADYLRDFPQGTYAKLAARLVRPSSP
jgi:hypothetical protein